MSASLARDAINEMSRIGFKKSKDSWFDAINEKNVTRQGGPVIKNK
jgi:hypothetical protein